jgi:hypothetical protein
LLQQAKPFRCCLKFSLISPSVLIIELQGKANL